MHKRHVWVAAAAISLLLAAVLFWVEFRLQRGRTGSEILLLRQTPAPGSILRHRDPLAWTYSDAMDYTPGSTVASGVVALIPPVAGRAEWTHPNVLTFTPDSAWPEDRDIRARVAPPPSLAGRRIAPAEFLFHGCPPLIDSVGRVGEDLTGRTLALKVKLSRPIDPEAFRQAFVLSTASGRVDYAVSEAVSNREYAVRTGRIGEPSVQAVYVARPGHEMPPVRLWEGTFAVIDPMDVQSVIHEEERDGMALKVTFSQPPAADWKAFVQLAPEAEWTGESGTGSTARIRGLKSGESYKLTFKEGLLGRNGCGLAREMTVPLTIPDMKTRLVFQDRGHYLSSGGSRKVIVESVNVKSAKLEVWRMYSNNLPELARSMGVYQDMEAYWSNPVDSYGDRVTNRVYKIDAPKNTTTKTVVDLADVAAGCDEGVFFLSIGDEAESHRWTHKMVIMTDLGLSVIRHEKEVLVWAVSLRKGAPVPGVAVSVYSAKNQLVGTAVTDASGLARLEKESLPQLNLVTAIKDRSFAMLKLGESLVQGPVDTGCPPYLTAPYEAFLYADRGIYRPGEMAHVKAVVRGPLLACPASFPVQLKVRRPDGALFATLTALLTEEGTAEFDLPFRIESMTGRYALELEAGGEGRKAGELTLQVEDFVPPTLTVKLQKTEGREGLLRPIPVQVEARHLFGSPAAGRRVTLRARVGSAPFQSQLFPDFIFGDSRKPEVWRTFDFGEKKLDDAGKADFEMPFPSDLNPAAVLSCSAAATVFEDSGRACPAVITFPIDPKPWYIGLKPMQAEWKEGENVQFRVVTVQPDGAAISGLELTWTLSRITWNWREERSESEGFRYRVERQLEPIREGTLVSGAEPIELGWEKAVGGEYEWEVRGATNDICASALVSVGGYQGWEGGSGVRQPDRVSIRFDRERYQPGQEAVMTLQAPFPGQVLLTLENDRIRTNQIINLTSNAVDVRLPVEPEYWPNIFVRAQLVRSQDTNATATGQVLLRATGAASLAVIRPEAEYRVAVKLPERTKPATTLLAEVSVRDASDKPVACEVTVAAVDEGILQLTGYQTPSPLKFFGARRSLDAWLHDVYAWILPDPEDRVKDRLHTGGDAMGEEMAGRLNPIRARRFVPTALWSGTLRTDENGLVRVMLPVPEFSGTLRVTAVAAGKGGFGSEARPVRVRRDWVVQAGLPRAAAPGDRFDLSCSVFNESGADGELQIEFTPSGTLGLDSPLALTNTLTRTLALGPAKSKAVAFSLKALEPGVGRVRLVMRANGERWEERIELPVRPAWPRVFLSGDGVVYPARSAALGLPDNWFPNTGTGRLVCSGQPGLEGLGALDFLDDYPYGCLEQTVSRAFPWLVAAELLAGAGRGFIDRGSMAARVGDGVGRVAAMQTPEGGFSQWPASAQVYDWGSAYALHFLGEAKAAGYAVPAEALERGCGYLEQKLGHTLKQLGRTDGPPLAVAAAHALAVCGRPDQAALSRLAQEEARWDYDTRTRLILAFLAAGRRAEAMVLLEKLGNQPESMARDRGGALRSSVRSNALLLEAWLQANPESPAIPPLVKRLIASRRDGRWGTTQENAWALLALGHYARQHKPGSASVSAVLSGTAQDSWTVTDSTPFTFQDARKMGNLALRNTGDTLLYYAWTASGIPAGATIKEEDKGLRIRRTFRNLTRHDGPATNENAIKQGDLLVVTLEVDGMAEPLDNLVIEELLPGGFEIENPNLPGDYAAFVPRDEKRLPVRYQTLRDDRLIAFTGVVSNGQRLSYLVRVVTPGAYVWPPATASGMYDPAIRSLNGSGRVVIEP
ncbi:MAG: alpha-2-macroglobulin [Kiritimatiellia bacterium]